MKEVIKKIHAYFFSKTLFLRKFAFLEEESIDRNVIVHCFGNQHLEMSNRYEIPGTIFESKENCDTQTPLELKELNATELTNINLK